MTKRLHLPDNIKVHFAGVESMSYANAIKQMGVNYALYSAFPFVYKKIFSKNKTITENDLLILQMLNDNMSHVIQDSGIFSLLYGSKNDLATKRNIFKWYDALVEWTLEHRANVTVVEVDCQDMLGTEVAWDLRERMRHDLPNHRIINVFHLCDGMKGLDRLIEFSDYIGVGSGVPNNSSYSMYEVSSYIKSKNPDIDIHLLGCTTLKTIKKCNFCTSCDSITWKSPLRFGRIGDYHIRNIDSSKVKKMVSEEVYDSIRKTNNELSTNAICAAIEQHKRWYILNAGNQDYTKTFNNT